jgi:Na+/H+-dicarboxylate symporter
MKRYSKVILASLKILKVIWFAVCFGLCVLLMGDVWEKYSSKMTTTGIQHSQK